MITTTAGGAVATPEDERINNTKAHQEDVHSDTSLFSDDDSTGSILSSDDDEVVPSSMKELQKEFKARDELLDQLVQGIDPKYARMMRENESAVRTQKIGVLRLQNESLKHGFDSKTPKHGLESTSVTMSLHSSTDNSTDKVADANILKKNISFMERKIPPAFTFDMQHRIQGAVILLLNCIAYNGGEQIVRSFVVFLSKSGEEFESMHLLPAVMLLVSFIVICLTGGIWDWVNDDAFGRIKFEMQNRLLLGRWDALIMKWFRRHEPIATTLNVLAFFTFVYCMYAFQEQFLVWAFDIRFEVFQGLPSVKQRVMTYPSKMLASKLKDDQVQRVLGEDVTCAAGVCNMDELHDTLTREDEAFLASSIAFDCYEDLMGDPTASVVTETTLFWYYTVSVVVAVITLRMMGHKFWSI